MKTLSVTAFLLLLTITIFAQNPTWDWTNSFGGYTNNNYLKDAAVDADGNFFITGFFSDELEIGTEFLEELGNGDSFDFYFAKFDANNNFQWAKSYGSTYQDYATGIATDANGDIYISGIFTGTIDLGNGVELTSIGLNSDWDAYLAKFSGTDGTAIWASTMGNGTEWDFGHTVCVDNTGNVYVAGEFEGTANFGGTDITASNGTDAFIAKFNTDGVFQWVNQISGYGYETILSINTDANSLFVAGRFDTQMVVGTETIDVDAGYDGFYAKYDFDGTFESVRHIAGAGDEFVKNIDIDASGNIALTGNFNTEIDFSGTTASANSQSGFVVYYDNTNTYQWHKIIESATKNNHTQNIGTNKYPNTPNSKDVKAETDITSNKITFDSEGNVYATGGYIGIVDFGLGNEHDASSFTDIFLVKYNNSGTTQFVETSTSSGNSFGDFGNGLAISNDDCIYIAGQFRGSIDFLGTTLVCPADAENFFIAKSISSEASAENDILTFTFPEQTGNATINNTNHTVEIEVEEGTDLTALIPTITISEAATIDPESGIEQDFSAPFNYTVTAENSDEQIWTITVDIVSNINNIENQISIYPNPSNGTFTITNCELQITNINITNIAGRLVLNETKEIDNQSTIINISNQPSGIYFLKINTENRIITKKIIIK